MNYFKKIIKVNNKDFLISSVLLLGNNYSILGFHKTSFGWSNHIICITLSIADFETAVKASES